MSKTTFSGPVASQNGFIENSFTTAQRDAIVDPAEGLLIYNTDTNTYEVFNGQDWQPAFGPAPVVLPKPNVTTFLPTSGPTTGGTTLFVSGFNFLFEGNPNVSTARLDFGGGITIDVTDIYVVSDTEFTCKTGTSYSGAVTNGVLRAYNANAQAGTASSTTFNYTLAPSFPFTLDYQQEIVNSVMEAAINFSPNGLASVSGSGQSINIKAFATPWNVASLLGSSSYDISSLPGFAPDFYFRGSTAWNQDGTKLNVLVADNLNGVAKACSITVGTPYEITTAQTFTVGTTLSLPSPYNGGVTLSANGAKAYVCWGGYVFQFALGTPYDFTTANSNYETANGLVASFGLYNNPNQFVTTADGTAGFVFQSGSTYSGEITQFQMLVPFDVSSINTGTYQTQTVGNGVGYVGYGGLGIKPDDSKLYISATATNMMDGIMLEYSVS